MSLSMKPRRRTKPSTVWPFPCRDGPFLGRTGPKSAKRQWCNLHPPMHRGWDGCSRVWCSDAYPGPFSFSHAPSLSWRPPNHSPAKTLSPHGPFLVGWRRTTDGDKLVAKATVGCPLQHGPWRRTTLTLEKSWAARSKARRWGRCGRA